MVPFSILPYALDIITPGLCRIGMGVSSARVCFMAFRGSLIPVLDIYPTCLRLFIIVTSDGGNTKWLSASRYIQNNKRAVNDEAITSAEKFSKRDVVRISTAKDPGSTVWIIMYTSEQRTLNPSPPTSLKRKKSQLLLSSYLS